MKTYIVGYDIEGNRARRRAAKALQKHGERVQRSVFEVHLRDDTQLDKLLGTLAGEIQDEGDADVRAWRISEDGRKSSRALKGDALVGLPAVIIV